MNKTAAASLHSSAVGADVAIRLSGVSKSYNLYRNKQDMVKAALHPRRKKYHTEFYALKNIDLEVKKGEVLGIIGRNGCGKSTLLKVISKVLTPTSGTVHTAGNVVALLELGAGFNPEFSGMENIYFYCSLLGYRKHEIEKMVDEILEFADIGDYIHQPIKTYSSGMKARLAFAVSINVNPDILILDEVLAVGDELFRRKCYAKMEQFFKGGKTILFVSHSIVAINQLCSRAVFLDKGEILLEGPTKLVTSKYFKYLQAQNKDAEAIKAEIINLNKDEKLKAFIFQEMLGGDYQEKKKNLNRFELDDQAGLDKNNRQIKEIFNKEPYFSADFKPLTTDIIKNADIDIYDNKISTLEGEQVNFLIRGEEYYYQCIIKSNIEAENIIVAFVIKNERGVIISKVGTNQENVVRTILIPKIKRSERYKISVSFRCIMNWGVFYTNISLHSYVNHDRKFLSRVEDSLCFKVLPEEENLIEGLVSLDQSITVDRID